MFSGVLGSSGYRGCALHGIKSTSLWFEVNPFQRGISFYFRSGSILDGDHRLDEEWKVGPLVDLSFSKGSSIFGFLFKHLVQLDSKKGWCDSRWVGQKEW